MEGNQLDTLYADIINGLLASYCKAKGFENYADYEFLLFYGTKEENTKKVGALSGTLAEDFMDGVYTVLQRISGAPEEPPHRDSGGIVDQ
jgi:hypothetical protein